ncbi:MAG: LysR family transcriptional regulator [Pseudomonadota bacterium]
MRAFAMVAKEASFTSAGARLGKSTRLISKYVADLEASLGVQLLYRTTRSVTLTDAGATYLEMCEPLLEGFDEMEERVLNAQSALKGRIRIAAPAGFGAIRLAPSLARFAQMHTEIEIELDLSDRRVSIVDEGLDLAVRIGPLRDSTLVARQLGPMPLVTVATPGYLKKFGTPKHPNSLSTHECVIDGNMRDPKVWRFSVGGKDLDVKVDGRLYSTSPAASLNFAKSGVAIARTPAYTASEALNSGRVVELFPENRIAPYTVAALYPANRRLTTRVRALIDHLKVDRALCSV